MRIRISNSTTDEARETFHELLRLYQDHVGEGLVLAAHHEAAYGHTCTVSRNQTAVIVQTDAEWRLEQIWTDVLTDDMRARAVVGGPAEPPPAWAQAKLETP